MQQLRAGILYPTGMHLTCHSISSVVSEPKIKSAMISDIYF